MTAIITRGDAAQLQLPDATVDLIVTSPPYFGLRSYTDGGEHYAEQVGAEATPAEYLDALIACTAEWMRVLKPGGSIFVNLGDKYAGTGASGGVGLRSDEAMRQGARNGNRRSRPQRIEGIPAKSLMMLPQRYAIRCIDELGLILRAEIVWAKPNGLPESVTDRVRRSHEQVFHFTKAPRYYSAIDAIREPHVTPGIGTGRRRHEGAAFGEIKGGGGDGSRHMDGNPLGKLPGSVWSIASSPLKVPEELGIDHFAAYPPELVRRIVLGWSPNGVCGDCGFLLGSSYDSGLLGVRKDLRSRPTRPTASVLHEDLREQEHSAKQEVDDIPKADDPRVRRGVEAGAPDGAEVGVPDGAPTADGRALGPTSGTVRGRAPQERDQDGQSDRELGTARQGGARPTTEASTQAIPVPALRGTFADLRELLPCPHCGSDRAERAVIADPFGGTGTTALVASVHGRVGISNDLSDDYCRLARWRTTDEKQRAKAAGVKPKVGKRTGPETPAAEQAHLFDASLPDSAA